jgi:hypothetical protein
MCLLDALIDPLSDQAHPFLKTRSRIVVGLTAVTFVVAGESSYGGLRTTLPILLLYKVS